jgi:asparagine synthase (glutamine-hydrolysing)
LLFASELKALRASGLIGAEIDPAALTGYLMLGAVPNPLTIYQGVKALPPASTLSWEQGQIAVQSYWQLPTQVDEAVTPEQAVEIVRDQLLEAVRIRLVSDVPLGAFLSGGLDSSAIVALMRAADGGAVRGASANGVIRTCSMTFAEEAYNEAPYARAVAEAAGTEHFERVISSADMQREWDRIFTAMDQPSIDGVNTYFVSQTAREAGLTVALSGLGGDELFGGYPNTFGDVPRMLGALCLVQSVPGGVPLARTAMGVMPGKARWIRVSDALKVPASPASAYLTRRGLFAPSEVAGLLQPEIWQQGTASFEPAAYVKASVNGTAYQGSGFDWISRAELRTYMHQQLLRDTDAMSMSHSLEVRVPFIDHRLVETVLRFPETVRRQEGGTLKPLLRQAVRQDLPPLVTERQNKQGFTFPFAVWLRGELRAQVSAALEQVQARGWLQAAAVQRVAQDYEAGRIHWSRLWAIVALDSVARR